MTEAKFRNLDSSSSSSSCSSSVHRDSVTAKRPMELICSVSLIANGILEDEDDDEHEDASSNSEFRLKPTVGALAIL
jgi:hypothetical protein